MGANNLLWWMVLGMVRLHPHHLINLFINLLPCKGGIKIGDNNMKKSILVKANNTTHSVENCKQLMDLLSEEQLIGWKAKFKSLGVSKRDLTRSVNNTINEFADIWHYKCDKTPCSVGYILSYVASYYEDVQK